MINQTSYAASTSENKPVLTGELFDIENGTFRVVAIDGFRLAIRTETIECQDNYHFVVPKKALSEVSGLIKEEAFPVREKFHLLITDCFFLMSLPNLTDEPLK